MIPKPPESFAGCPLREERATEIVSFLNGETETKFMEQDSNRRKRSLAEQAVRMKKGVDEIPANYQKIINSLFPPEDDFKNKRVGKQMSPERAAALLHHLEQPELDPHWREDDSTVVIRRLLRDAISLKVLALEKPQAQLEPNERPLIASAQKALECGTSPAEVLSSDLRKIDHQYPLAS